MTLSDASGRFLPEPSSPPTSVALAGSLFLREISFSQELCICTGELCRSKTKLALVSTCCSESLDSEKKRAHRNGASTYQNVQVSSMASDDVICELTSTHMKRFVLYPG